MDRKIILGLLLFAGIACTPQEPTNPEPSATAAETPAVAPTVNPTPLPAVNDEPLALRFVTPNLGPPAGGNEITIDGRGFSDYPRVTFGGELAWIRSVTPTEIRVTVPPPDQPVATGETRVVDVTVTHPPQGSDGSVSETLPRSYSYVDDSVDTSGDEPTAEPAAEPTPKAGGARPMAPVANVTETKDTPTEEAAPRTPTLVASFSFDVTTDSEDCPPPNISIRFTDRSTGGATEWWWDFGDGNTSKERHHEHCYSAPGMRSVTLTVSNDQESASTSKIVTAGME